MLASYEAISAFNTFHLTPAEEESFKSLLQSCDEQHTSLLSETQKSFIFKESVERNSDGG